MGGSRLLKVGKIPTKMFRRRTNRLLSATLRTIQKKEGSLRLRLSYSNLMWTEEEKQVILVKRYGKEQGDGRDI